MAASYSICVLPGDGIGAEVTDCARRVLDALAAHGGPSFTYDTQAAGHGTFLEGGDAMPEGVLAAAKAADAVLLGAMDVAAIPPGGGDPLGDMRIGLEVAASVRPSREREMLRTSAPPKGASVATFRRWERLQIHTVPSSEAEASRSGFASFNSTLKTVPLCPRSS